MEGSRLLSCGTRESLGMQGRDQVRLPSWERLEPGRAKKSQEESGRAKETTDEPLHAAKEQLSAPSFGNSRLSPLAQCFVQIVHFMTDRSFLEWL